MPNIAKTPNYRYLALVSEERERMFMDMKKAVCDDYMYGSYQSAKDMYPYLPLSHSEFLRLLDKHLRPGMRVIDIGCGAGDKLLALQAFKRDLQITGIEYHPTMAAVARYIAPFANVITGNAFHHDFFDYDILYMYRPIPDNHMQADLQRHVMLTMRAGAKLFVVYQAFEDDMKLPNGLKGRELYWFPTLEGWVKP